MRRLLPLAACLTLLLSACGGSKTEIACTQPYWDGVIGTCLPSGWHALSKDQMRSRGVPPDVIAGFEREQPVAGQSPIVIVLREQLPSAMDNAAYEEASMNTVKGLPSYEEIDQRSTDIDDEDAVIHIYSAQPLPERPKGKFYQLGAVKDTVGYTMTAALPLSPDGTVEDEVLLILDGFTFVQQGE